MHNLEEYLRKNGVTQKIILLKVAVRIMDSTVKDNAADEIASERLGENLKY